MIVCQMKSIMLHSFTFMHSDATVQSYKQDLIKTEPVILALLGPLPELLSYGSKHKLEILIPSNQ